MTQRSRRDLRKIRGRGRAGSKCIGLWSSCRQSPFLNQSNHPHHHRKRRQNMNQPAHRKRNAETEAPPWAQHDRECYQHYSSLLSWSCLCNCALLWLSRGSLTHLSCRTCLGMGARTSALADSQGHAESTTNKDETTFGSTDCYTPRAMFIPKRSGVLTSTGPRVISLVAISVESLQNTKPTELFLAGGGSRV